MAREWLRHLVRRVCDTQAKSPSAVDVARAVLFGNVGDVERTAALFAAHQRELADQAEERERYAANAKMIEQRVRDCGGAWLPDIDD